MRLVRRRRVGTIVIDQKLRSTNQSDVVVIGGGPAGLSAAIELKRRGVSRVTILERESEAGGIPRHCGHLGFGMREFSRILTGPQYATKLVGEAQTAGVEIYTSTTVVKASQNGSLLVATDKNVLEINAGRIIYATGVRETPRSARLISGSRPLGVMNTGALQAMTYLKGRRPFERPVIVGTELVSFSAIMTCRHARIRPVAMIEENHRATARWPSSLFPGLVGIPLHLRTRLVRIEGKTQVNAVVVEDATGQRRKIDCDGVILTGQFTPEVSLGRSGHLAIDPASGGPVVDQYGRCSDPQYFATGNILRPVETAGWSWNEGRQTASWVANDLAGKLAAREAHIRIAIRNTLIKYVVPQQIALPNSPCGMEKLQLRFVRRASGELVVRNATGVLWKRRLRVWPERRVLVPLRNLGITAQTRIQGDDLQVELLFEQSGQ